MRAQQKNSFCVYITKFNLDTALIGVKMLKGQMFCLGEAGNANDFHYMISFSLRC